MSAKIIDGKLIATHCKNQIADEIRALTNQGHRPPCLAVVLVGDDPASQIYVRNKGSACKAVGIHSETIRLAADTSQEVLETKLKSLSADGNFDGILLQLPLPKALDADSALDCIAVEKDVDGLLPLNQGLLLTKRPGLFSCTPLGCMELIRSTGIEIAGKNAVVIGRSLLVGGPVAVMLQQANATVTVIHSRTREPQAITKQADIVVVAAGQQHLVNRQWIKPGSIVIDVGMHRHDGKLSGDVDFDDVSQIAGYITPVPGGVGPMTITMLLSNCLTAYRRRLHL